MDINHCRYHAFFGAKRIPGLARGLGQAITEFRNARADTLDKEKDE